MDEQRRKQQRRAIRGMGSFVLPGSQIEVRLLDISTQGMGVVAPLPMPIGTRCSARFGLPNESGRLPVQLDATVIGCVLSGNDGGFRLGMQFSALPSATRSAIEDYVTS